MKAAAVKKNQYLANVYEALIAAIYYDSDFATAFSLIEKHCAELIDEVVQKGYFRDFKSRLQEYAQRSLQCRSAVCGDHGRWT